MTWKLAAVCAGAKPQRCYESHVIVNLPWIGTCPICTKIYHKHKRPKRHGACHICCAGKWRKEAVIKWTFKGQEAIL